VVIPYAPGAATDTPGRILITKLSETSRFQTVIDNRPGAGGTVGAGIVARAAADGYTLLITSTMHVIAGQLYKNLGFRPVDDFTEVMRSASRPTCWWCIRPCRRGRCRSSSASPNRAPGRSTTPPRASA
jgi:tripartite-type tricarboxylate transporter receptor subunit TctC